jgi:gliding motility-associated-like protein
VPKIIPHKKLIFTVIFLCCSWIIFAQTPSITITKNGAGICPSGSIGLACADAGLVSYSWQFYRGSVLNWSAIPNASNASLVHNEVGKYRLLATDVSGNNRYSNELDIPQLTAPATPVFTLSRNVTQICQGDSIILTSSFQSGYFYYWIVDNVQQSIPQTTKFVAKKAATYELLSVDQSPLSNACSAKSLPYKLDYSSAITLKIDSVAPFCSVSAAPINLVVTPTGGQFKGKGITDKNLGTFNPSVAGLGKSEITYEYSQSGSCPVLTTQRTIIVSEPKPIITTNTGKIQFCVGDIATLSVLPDMKKYDWYKDGNPTPVGALSKLDIGAGGKFKVKIIEKESLCEKTSPEVNIEFASAVNPTIATIPSGCGTNFPTVPLSGSPSGGAFTINGTFATTFDYGKVGFGKHKVVYTLSGALPCLQGSSQQEVEIQDFPKPDLGPDIFLGSGNSVTLRGFIDANLTYSWSPTTGLDNATVANPVANPVTTQEYTLTATTSLGCPGTGKVNVVVYEPIYIPTAFTPNGDAMNDTWELRGLENYPNPEVQIFNRWGNTIFYSKGKYMNNFNGFDNGKALPEGIYIYKINPFPDRPTFQFKGTFTLLR